MQLPVVQTILLRNTRENLLMFQKIMTTQIILFIFFISSLFIFEQSYGAIAPREDPSIPQIHLQIVLRNSEGQLVSYIQTDFVYIRNLYLTHEYLDSIENKTTFVKDGIPYERIQWQKTENFNTQKQITAYGLMYKDMAVLLVMHDSYTSQPGDVFTVSWDIIRVQV